MGRKPKRKPAGPREHARPDADRASPLPDSGSARAGGVALPAVGLFVLTLVVFSPVLGHQFLTWDDLTFVVQNPAYNPPTWASLRAYWTQVKPSDQFYVPVMQSLWWALAALTGRAAPDGSHLFPAWPFHAANWVAHASAAVLVFLLLRRLVKSRAAAWLGAALFALHPIQAEAVSWVSTLYTPMSAALALAALWQLARSLELRYDAPPATNATVAPPHRRRRAWIALAAGTLFFAAGLLTKPAVVLTPVIGVILEVALRRRPWRQVVAPAAFWLLLAVPVMVVARVAQPQVFPYWPVWQRPLIAADALTFYATKILLPVNLATDYGRSPNFLVESGAWRYTWIFPCLVSAGIVWLSVRRRTVWPAACAAVFVAAALPTLGLSPFHYQDYSTVADRYVYFAMFGLAIAAAGLLTLPRAPGARRAAYAGAAAVVALLGVLAHLQTYRWHDTITLFRHTLDVNPHSVVANQTLGDIAMEQGDLASAAVHFGAALEANPESKPILGRLGDLSSRLGRYPEAVAFYERIETSKRPPPPGAKFYANYGAALSQSGRQDEAAAALERAISLDPKLRDAHLSLAVVRAKQQRWDASRGEFEAALRIDPGFAPAREGLEQLKAMGH